MCDKSFRRFSTLLTNVLKFAWEKNAPLASNTCCVFYFFIFSLCKKLDCMQNGKPSGKMSKCLTNKIVVGSGHGIWFTVYVHSTQTRIQHTGTDTPEKSVFLVKYILIESYSLQLQWNVYPICYLPASLRAKPISDLNTTALGSCIDFDNDLYDMGGISQNILLIRGNHIHRLQFKPFNIQLF